MKCISKFHQLTNSFRFGALPGLVFGITAGYLIGKFSYIGTCRELFLKKLPNSNMSKIIRKSTGMEPLSDEVDIHLELIKFYGSQNFQFK